MLSIYLSMVETEEEKDLVTELYNTYKQILFNVSMSILHNTANAEDAVQETFVRIISNLSKIDCATVIVVTHDKSVAEKCDRIIEIADGEIVSDSK